MTQKYYILLAYLPAELIRYIYIINLKDKSANTLIKHFKHQQIKQKIIKRFVKLFYNNINSLALHNNLHNSLNIINNSLNPAKFTTFKNELKLISAELKYILNSNYSRAEYTYYFWQHFLTLLSKSLMNYHIAISNIPHPPTDIPKILKNKLNSCIHLWYKLCIKHNIRLAILFNNKTLYKNYVYISARQAGPITDFDRFMVAPIVVGNRGEFIDNSFNMTLTYLNLINSHPL
jgi:hypothetical protein